MIVIADTSGLLAAVDSNEKEHDRCRSAISRASLLVIPPFVLAEFDYLVMKHLGEATGIVVSEDIAASVRKRDYEIARITPEIITESSVVRAQYRNLQLGLTDAANIVLAARYRTNTLLTLDRRHFRAVRPIVGDSEGFQLLPDDIDWC